MTRPCVDCKVICAMGNSDPSCNVCESLWEQEKTEKKTQTSIAYWKHRETQPTGQIDMWEE